MTLLSFLFRKHPIAAGLLALCLAGLAWFTFSTVREAMYFSDPAHHEQDLQEWMSPRYVGKSWDLPPETIVRIMELEPDFKQPTLRHVTEHLGITMAQLQDRVEAAKAEQEAMRHGAHGPPHGPPGGPRNDPPNGAADHPRKNGPLGGDPTLDRAPATNGTPADNSAAASDTSRP